MTITYVAVVNNTTGEIKSLQKAKGSNNLAEGYHEHLDGDVVHITSEIPNTVQFVNETYYDYDSSSWVAREARPNYAATWDGTGWSWEHEDFLYWVRRARNVKIAETDWTVLGDSPLTDAQKTEAQTYRQSLRDVPSNLPDDIRRVEDIVWPTKPDFL